MPGDDWLLLHGRSQKIHHLLFERPVQETERRLVSRRTNVSRPCPSSRFKSPKSAQWTLVYGISVAVRRWWFERRRKRLVDVSIRNSFRILLGYLTACTCDIYVTCSNAFGFSGMQWCSVQNSMALCVDFNGILCRFQWYSV